MWMRVSKTSRRKSSGSGPFLLLAVVGSGVATADGGGGGESELEMRSSVGLSPPVGLAIEKKTIITIKDNKRFYSMLLIESLLKQIERKLGLCYLRYVTLRYLITFN